MITQNWPTQLSASAFLCPHGAITPAHPEDLLASGQVVQIAGTFFYASMVRVFTADHAPFNIPVAAMPEWLDALEGPGAVGTRQRWAHLCAGPTGFGFGSPVPNIMGVLNVTPDSFSDGGKFLSAAAALDHAQRMKEQGADIIDIGGESTRPGADPVTPDQEWQRIETAITEVAQHVTVSVDTRHAQTATRATQAGAHWINDVMGGREPGMLAAMAQANVPVVLMHSQGQPKTMQQAPSYDHVLLEVMDFLEARVDAAVAAGVPRHKILIDPGIGFGKTVEHNLALIRHVAGFHGLGCPILFGVSRKSLIGKLSPAETPEDRVAGSLAFALEAVRQGCQVVRVHDVYETKQALNMYVELNAR